MQTYFNGVVKKNSGINYFEGTAKYFTTEELACKCCGQVPEQGIDPKLLELLDEIRETAGVPINVNCAYRCPSHNAEVGGVVNSQHVDGTAADLDASSIGVEALAQIAEACGADGVGRYFDDEFVHVDVRSGKIGDNYRW